MLFYAIWGYAKLVFVYQKWPDYSVWADKCALVALDAVLLDPFWHDDANAALLVSCRASFKVAVFVAYEG